MHLSSEETAQRIGSMIDAILARHDIPHKKARKAIEVTLEMFGDDGDIMLMEESELEAEFIHQWNVLQAKQPF